MLEGLAPGPQPERGVSRSDAEDPARPRRAGGPEIDDGRQQPRPDGRRAWARRPSSISGRADQHPNESRRPAGHSCWLAAASVQLVRQEDHTDLIGVVPTSEQRRLFRRGDCSDLSVYRWLTRDPRRARRNNPAARADVPPPSSGEGASTCPDRVRLRPTGQSAAGRAFGYVRRQQPIARVTPPAPHPAATAQPTRCSPSSTDRDCSDLLIADPRARQARSRSYRNNHEVGTIGVRDSIGGDGRAAARHPASAPDLPIVAHRRAGAGDRTSSCDVR